MMYITKIIIHFYLFTVIKVLTQQGHSDNESFETILEFVVKLRNTSDDFIDYAAKIQALFCPEQPICTDEGITNASDVLKTLPKAIAIDTETYRIEEVHKSVGACCLPCTCETKRCREDGNCCLSKLDEDVAGDANADTSDTNANMRDADADTVDANADMGNNYPGNVDANADTNGSNPVMDYDNPNTDGNIASVYSECIKASWLSYENKDTPEIQGDLDIDSYFMITKCFMNKFSDRNVSMCESPMAYHSQFMFPVTSSFTGRIYWNAHCASCNNDDKDFLSWTPIAKFQHDISYFLNRSSYTTARTPYPKTYTDVLSFIAQNGNIVYTPPFPHEEKQCLRKNIFFPCKHPDTHIVDDPMLERAIQNIYSPVIIADILGRPYPFPNILYYIFVCRNQYIHKTRSSNEQCGYKEETGKVAHGGMTALMDYTALDSGDNSRNTEERHDKCRCDELLDVYLHYCRRVYCPAGEFMVGCQCVQPLKKIYGMPVLLTIKLVPQTGDLVSLERKQISKYHTTLKSILRAITENIFVEFIGLFECKADPKDYFLSLVVIRSFPGHDSKATIKPFLDHLENKKMANMKMKRITYSVKLTSSSRFWNELNGTLDRSIPHLTDLAATVHNYTVLFSANDIHKVYDQKFQALSPLLYCQQIQLNHTEFEERNGRLTTLLTPKNITLSYYNRVSPSEVRVCTDHYIYKHQRSTGNRLRPPAFYTFISWILII